MICKNCGALNSDEAIFCENCGTNLRNAAEDKSSFILNAEQMQFVPVKRKFPVLTVVLAVEAILLIFLVYAGIIIMENKKSPQQVAESYFTNAVNGDWEAAFSEFEERELNGDFITAESFAKSQRGNSIGIVENYQVLSQKKVSDGLGIGKVYSMEHGVEMDEVPFLDTIITIEYQLQGAMETENYEVSLSDKTGNWKVNIENLICSQYHVYVPMGTEVSIDGVVLDQEYAAPQADDSYYSGLDGYCIPYIFYGFHDLKITMDGMEDFTDTIQIGNGDSQYYLEYIPFKQETLDELLEKSKENMKTIYSAAMAGKNFNTIADLFTAEKENLTEIQESYEYLLSGFNEGSIQPEKIEFENIAGYISRENGSVLLEFEYKMDYMEEDWWSGELEENDLQDESESEIHFIRENGSWVQTNLGCNRLY